MRKELQLVLPPEIAFQEEACTQHILKKAGLSNPDSVHVRLLRRSIDARQRQIKVNLKAELFINEPLSPLLAYQKDYPHVSQAPPAIIVGCGPAGMFAALRLIELGIKPIILDRGKDVQARRRDLAAINKEHIVNPNSNYCFGEGGAGTYSDGKLYTRSKKRGDLKRVLEILVAHGAVEDILIDAHPHIGTNKLPKIIQAMRESILEAGGEVHFDSKVTDFILKNGAMQGVITEKGDHIEGIGVILATGHSARDIFTLLQEKSITIEFKPFALGVRMEHPQSIIDGIQYKKKDRGEYLPAAAYALSTQVKFQAKERGVFSFCMCPGGFIVPSATAEGEVVVNGMSPSRRNSKYANSGLVVSVDWEDVAEFHKFGALAGLEFQKSVEQKAFQVSAQNQAAPAQRLVDFVGQRVSGSLADCSYQPGLISLPMDIVLPPFISQSLRDALKIFGKKAKAYLTNEAQIIGVESRTSSPVRIPRDKESTEHIQIARLFPCGEGAGYAGGIVSAAMDGEKCAEKLVQKYKPY